VPALIIVMAMIYRDYILEAMLKYTKRWPFLHKRIEPWFEHVIRPRILLFAHHPHKLYRSLEYIRRNETSRRITVVFCKEHTEDSHQLLKEFEEYVDVFKRAHVFKNFDLSLEVEENLAFGPDTVRAYAQRFRVNNNYIFIGSIHDSHTFSFEELGGVRIIQ
jgi:UDP-N-acetylmuramate-alanine ligase